MNATSEFDVCIVGAGMAGLSLALLLQKRGLSVALVESHSKVGGCASYFSYKKRSFDVGATTLTGFSPGRPLHHFFSRIELIPEAVRVDPGVVIHRGEHRIHRWNNCDRFAKELAESFQEFSYDQHFQFWKHAEDLNDKVWPLLCDLPRAPTLAPKYWKEFFQYSLKHRPYFLAKHWVQDTDAVARKFYRSKRSNGESQSLSGIYDVIRELSLITAQSPPELVPFAIGALGLSYVKETYYWPEGMKGFCQSLQNCFVDRGGQLFLRSPVREVKKNSKSFHVGFAKEKTLTANQVVSSVPAFESRNFLSNEINQMLGHQGLKRPACWSAFTAYFLLETEDHPEAQYHQVHLPSPLGEATSYFVSFSSPKDKLRVQPGEITATLSVHRLPANFFLLSEDEYKQQKELFGERLLDHFRRDFAYLGIKSLQVVAYGTPRTFYHYTRREDGQVGGIPVENFRYPWDMKTHESKVEGLSFIGDNTFPGQGICGVILGSLLFEKTLAQ